MSICTIKVFDHLHCAIATFNAAAHSRKTDGEGGLVCVRGDGGGKGGMVLEWKNEEEREREIYICT